MEGAVISSMMIASCLAFGQSTPLPAFEVASVKALGNVMPKGRTIGPQRFDMAGSVKSLVQWAYDVESYQITGGPSWSESDRYEVAAKTEHPADAKELKLMLRSLLKERFQLNFHRETKEMAVQSLRLGKKGAKLRATEEVELKPSELPSGALPFCGLIISPRGGADMDQLAKLLTYILGQVVVDETGLQGRYDIRGLKFDPSSTAATL
jgi:uncharacterized protein (TIGR03435 family)